MTTIIMLDAFDKQKLLAGEELEFEMTDRMKGAKSLVIKLTPNAIDQPVESLSDNTFVRNLIDDAMEKHDRSVSIYISGDGSISANVYPWPNLEDLYDMYKEGMISLDEFREKSGLQMIAKEDIDKR